MSLGPSITTRLEKQDHAYLKTLAKQTKIKPAWYLRRAFEEWKERQKHVPVRQ